MTILEELNSVGIYDKESNQKYAEKLIEGGVNDIHLKFLNDDNIDLNELWEIARKIDKVSIVGGNLVDNNEDVDTINYYANKLATNIGAGPNLSLMINSYLESNKTKPNVLECGAGYGNIHKTYKNYCNYYGFDVVKSFDECIISDGKSIPEELYKKDFYNIVYTCNVFQHVSLKNKENYIKNFSDVLSKGGSLILSTNLHNLNAAIKDSIGNTYCYTVGQLTKLDKIDDFHKTLTDNGFYIRMLTQRYDGFTCFICEKY